jgi:hypothetical protein
MMWVWTGGQRWRRLRLLRLPLLSSALWCAVSEPRVQVALLVQMGLRTLGVQVALPVQM